MSERSDSISSMTELFEDCPTETNEGWANETPNFTLEEINAALPGPDVLSDIEEANDENEEDDKKEFPSCLNPESKLSAPKMNRAPCMTLK